MSEWISINEKVPSKGDLVYFLLDDCEFKGVYDGFFIQNGKIQHSFSGNQGYGGITTTIKATHWRNRDPRDQRITTCHFEIGFK